MRYGDRNFWNTTLTYATCCLLVFTSLISTRAVAASGDDIPTLQLETLDLVGLKARDAATKDGSTPLQFAEPFDLQAKAMELASWRSISEGRSVWQVRFIYPNALSINFGLKNVFLPKGAVMYVYSEEDGSRQGPYTHFHNKEHGELWTAIVPGERAIIEVTVPDAEKENFSMDVASVNGAYRDFAKIVKDKQGSCNVDVVCSQGNNWRDEIRSVGVYTLNGSWTCTGTLIMNQRQDFRNYFLTANHCSVTTANDHTMVVYWNYESPTCGQLSGGSLTDNQSGCTLRAKYSNSDFCLVELTQTPSAGSDVHYAGWDRGNSAPVSAVAIHHPSTDEKAISFEYNALQSTSYLSSSPSAGATHWRVIDWDVGTTEPGSSGSGLWDGTSHRLVGQLHGGYAACGNNLSDWYGKIWYSWTGGGTSSSRLSDWLDPDSTGLTGMDGSDPSVEDAYEENDSLATATDFTTEATWLSSIAGNGTQTDIDWYEISVSPSGYERVVVDCRFTDADGDIDIALMNSSGTMLARSVSITDNEYISYVVPAAGTYYIVVYYGNAGNSYDLWWDDLVPPASSARLDFDGDGRSDLGVYVASSGYWSIRRSSGLPSSIRTETFGYTGTKPVVGDFDGDGTTDFGCYDAYGLYGQPGGSWYFMNSSAGFTTARFGYGGTVPVVGDFDGDNTDDYGCYDAYGYYGQPSGSWYYMNSSAGFTTARFGYGGTVPVVGDFDGDNTDDYGCYDAYGLYGQPSGSWYYMNSSAGFTTDRFGYGGTVPVVGDFDGDGTDDYGCYDAAGISGLVNPGTWYLMMSSAGFTTDRFGYAGTVPVVGDFDGDGTDDYACYDANGIPGAVTAGTWFIRASSAGFYTELHGGAGAVALGGSY